MLNYKLIIQDIHTSLYSTANMSFVCCGDI